jgi:hypothetical protein
MWDLAGKWSKRSYHSVGEGSVHKYSRKTVTEILKEKKGSIKNAALGPGAPSWDDIKHLLWEELVPTSETRRTRLQNDQETVDCKGI